MNYRKLTADKVFDGYRFLEDQVLVLSAEGVVEDLVKRAEAGDDIEAYGGIISPGFINCHCHLELSHMKGQMPEGTGLVDFVYKVVTERQLGAEQTEASIARAEDEMIENGIVAVGDICNNLSTLRQKEQQRLSYYNFIEASGWLPAAASDRFGRAMNLYGAFAAVAPFNAIVPHAPYSVSENLWREISPCFSGKVVSIHNQETAFEDEFFMEGKGDFLRMYGMMNIDNSHHKPTKKSSLQSYFQNLLPASSAILVHNTFTSQRDLDYVGEWSTCLPAGREGNGQSVSSHRQKRTADIVAEGSRLRTHFCLCINANLYIENKVPPIELLRRNHCSIVLGTDSLASNWSLSIADEIKTLKRYFPLLPMDEVLRWATLNGAKALEMDQQLGSFEKGKKPGVICFNDDLSGLKRLI
jgi:aminodeoxyfutalosine deaminase